MAVDLVDGWRKLGDVVTPTPSLPPPPPNEGFVWFLFIQNEKRTFPRRQWFSKIVKMQPCCTHCGPCVRGLVLFLIADLLMHSFIHSSMHCFVFSTLPHTSFPPHPFAFSLFQTAQDQRSVPPFTLWHHQAWDMMMRSCLTSSPGFDLELNLLWPEIYPDTSSDK